MPLRASRRRAYLDWLRGLAVLIMIEAHTINSWTATPDQARPAYGWAMIVGGFGAPLFLFLAGIGVALAGAARTEKLGSRRAAGARVARRGWEIFGLAFLFRLQAYLLNPGASAIDLLKVDILNIMGLAMVAAAWLWALPGPEGRRLAALGLATLAVGSLPPSVRGLASLSILPDPLEWYLRPAQGRTNFVFFPWAAFLFGGAVAGLLLTPSTTPMRPATGSRRPELVEGRERRTVVGLGAAGLVLAAVAYGGSYLPSLFANSSFWTSSPSFFFLRLGVLLMLVPIAFFWRAWPAAHALSPIEIFGRSSLFVYWVHVELVYGFFSAPLHRRLPLEWAFAAFAVFTVLMYGVVVVKNRSSAGIRDSGVGIRGFWKGRRASPVVRSPTPEPRPPNPDQKATM